MGGHASCAGHRAGQHCRKGNVSSKVTGSTEPEGGVVGGSEEEKGVLATSGEGRAAALHPK